MEKDEEDEVVEETGRMYEREDLTKFITKKFRYIVGARQAFDDERNAWIDGEIPIIDVFVDIIEAPISKNIKNLKNKRKEARKWLLEKYFCQVNTFLQD